MSSSPSTSPGSNNRPSPVARWAQDTFSRESIVSGIKTLAWLAPLTLLIWVYAERSQVVPSPPPGETIPIKLRSSDPKRFSVKLAMPVDSDRSVVAQLLGPLARIEQVIREIAPQNDNASVVLTVNASQAGVTELDAARELSLNPIFARQGVSVFNCKPPTIKVIIDEIGEDEAEVQFRRDQNEIFSATFNPATVKVSAPLKDLADAKSKGPLVVFADFDRSILQQPGSHEDVTVRFLSEQLSGESVAFTPPSVKATVVVRQSEDTKDLKGIPIQIRVLPDISNSYRVVIEGDIKTIPSVPVTGPPDKVLDLINTTQLKAYAELPILRVTTEKQSAIPEIHLPDPSVRVDSKYIPKEIYYTLVKRDQP